MSTLTPNYGLIVPDNTDTVAQVRADYATNLGTIDQNLGGGGGSSSLAGLTDVSLSSPTNGQVLSYNSTSQKWENTNGGGGGGDTYNVYGAFIDTANVVQSRTGFRGSDTYTATEDCFVSYELACPVNDNAYVEIDGVAVCTYYYPSVCLVSDTIPLKTGQTISFSNADSGFSSYYTVYGITQGVNQVGEHYSTSEQVIGTWNGKPLYRQTITFNTGVVPSNIGVNITSYMPANCVVVDTSFFIEYSYEGIDYRNVNVNGGYTTENTTHYFYFSIGSAQYDKHVELTIKYTKTTD